tara:strand:- start:905 stop:1249 length:345 start_codon:yes stop_codon:yes gene_type:complete
MDTNPRDIKGMRGSWFAKTHTYKEYLPIMWSYEYDGKTRILETGWMTKESIQQSKRNNFKNFFKENLNKEIPIALAEAKDKNKHPHEIKEYKAVFIAEVLAYEPEIKLEFKKRG